MTTVERVKAKHLPSRVAGKRSRNLVGAIEGTIIATAVAAGLDESDASAFHALWIVLATGSNLGIPKKIDAAVEAGLHGQRRKLDVGSMNGERFAVMAGVGFDAIVIHAADRALERRLGLTAYVMAAAKSLPRSALSDVTKSPFVHVTKGRSVQVKLSRKVLYELDGGDREKKKTFHVDIQPGAVTVCVPAGKN